MDERIEKYKRESVYICDKLYSQLKINREEIDSFFGGDMRKAYTRATEIALDEISKIRRKLRNI